MGVTAVLVQQGGHEIIIPNNFFYLRSANREKLYLFHLHCQVKLPKVTEALLLALDKSREAIDKGDTKN